MRHRGRDQESHCDHKREEADALHGLTVPRGILKPLLEDHLKLAAENDLRSEYQEPAFVERHLELFSELHRCSAHLVNV